MKHTALLVMMTDVPDEHEQAFNDWYETEHIPEALALPGMLSAERYRVVGEGIRYLAIYRMADVNVPETEVYRKWREKSVSTDLWVSRFTRRERYVYELISSAP